MPNIGEVGRYLVLGILALFLVINFDTQVGLIYFGMAVLGSMYYQTTFLNKNFKIINVDNPRTQKIMDIVFAMGAYVVFIFVANFVIGSIFSSSSVAALDRISSLILQTFSATPILFGSDFMKLAVWGVIIPILETIFFFRDLPQTALNFFNIKMPNSAFEPKAWAIAAFFGAVFSIFHIVAKGIADNEALLVTFVFGVISVLLIIHLKEVTQAIFLHIITNTLATMFLLGIVVLNASGLVIAGVLILLGMILLSWMLIYGELPLPKKRLF